MVTTFWIVADYRKWLQVAYIRTAIKENLVLPLLQHKKKKYKIIGVEHDGTFLLESLDTESHVKLHYRKVKFLWK
jgi:hypothetical protein